ncbi:MAG: tetratricopeptide repeat protein [Bacteroidales bacterium]|nr:tetratricopeptide repeat protein [Bacteroidales bacterium]
MKKSIALFWILALTVSVFGQQPVDIILKAKALNSAGQPEVAIKVLSDAITGSNESALYLERAEAKLLQRNFSDAISDLNEANKITPASGEYSLSRVYAAKGDAATSLYHLELSMNSSDRRPEKEIMLDPAFRLIEGRPEWRQFWKKEWYSAVEKSISEIEFYVSSGMTDEGKEVLSDLKKSYGNSDDVIYAEALISFSSGRYDETVRSVTGLIASKPGSEKYLRLLARAQAKNGNPAGASDTYTRLLDAGVADAEILILRAESYRKTGEDDKALRDLEKYLGLYPENKTALSLAGRVEASSGDNLKALEYFSKNLKLHPNDPECYVDRANSYFVAKSWDWAIKDYSMSLDLSPANSDAWLNKGIAQLSTGKVEDACHDFRRALSLGNKRASEYISSKCIR